MSDYIDKQRHELENAIRSYRSNVEHFEMSIKCTSEALYMRYKALIKAGFTAEQAFEIIKARGLAQPGGIQFPAHFMCVLMRVQVPPWLLSKDMAGECYENS